MNRFYSNLLNPIFEGVDQGDLLVATYLVGADKTEEAVLKAASIGIEQTTGSWSDVPAETDEMRLKYCSKILSVYEVPDYENAKTMNQNVKDDDLRFYIMRIGYPVANVDDNIPLLLATITGNITAMPYLRLVDLDLPAKFCKKFKGPKFGIDGVYDILGIKEKRPLLNNMIKPCTGYAPEVGAKLFYEAAAGGVDIIKDDELLGGDREFNHVVDRVRMNMEAAKRADEEKGETTMYAVNITDEVSRLRGNAYKAIEAGANCLLVDTFCVGLSGLRMLAEDPKVTVPIMSHCCFGSALTVSQYQGLSSYVLTKLTRLCGADIMLLEPPYGKFDILFSKYIKNVTACNGKMYDIKPTLPFVGGGVIPGLVPQLLDDLGAECLLGVGAGIHAHPMGPQAGAKAFRKAIDATMHKVDLRTAAKDCKELQAAIDQWGIYGEENIKDNYAI